MCWSLEASLGAGVWCWVVALFVLYRNRTARDRWTAFWLMSFSSMQFIDVIFWYDEKTTGLAKCSRLNMFASQVGRHWHSLFCSLVIHWIFVYQFLPLSVVLSFGCF